MKILVNANSLVEKGGISVVNNFINDISNSSYLNKNNISITIIVSDKFDYQNSVNNNINIIYTTNKYRGYFKKIESNLYVKKLANNYDAFLSLQNTGISNLKIPQFIFIHTALPFVDIPKEYNIFKYRVLLKFYYKLNLKKFNAIFVQAEWLKKNISQNFKYDINKINVIRPLPNDIILKNKELDQGVEEKLNINFIKFLYPTRNEKYKNIERLISAIENYNRLYRKKVVLYLTFEGKDSENIKYLGNVDYNCIYTLYKKIDAVIFPSLVETLGLPLQESLIAKRDLLVADLNYSREVIGDHEFYFNPYDVNSMVKCIAKYTENKEKIKTFKKIDNRGDYLDTIKYIYQYLNNKKINDYR